MVPNPVPNGTIIFLGEVLFQPGLISHWGRGGLGSGGDGEVWGGEGKGWLSLVADSTFFLSSVLKRDDL